MRGTLVALAASSLVCALAAHADAQLILRNDSFNGSGQVGAQGGFAPGEAGASRFVAPSGGRTLQAVTFFYGGATGTHNITLHVYDDSAQALDPGTELYNAEYQVMGSDTALSSIDLNGMNVIVPAVFRVAIELDHMGAPSLARDNDGRMANRNFIHGDFLDGSGFIWHRSEEVPLLNGDWIIRATVSDTGGPGPDAGVIDAPSGGPDASNPGPDGGGSGTCSGNGDCGIGSYCDPDLHTCTFDCRNDNDCGSSDQCNSLGQCVAADGEAGGCCSTGTGGGMAGSMALGAGVALLLARRRRNRAA